MWKWFVQLSDAREQRPWVRAAPSYAGSRDTTDHCRPRHATDTAADAERSSGTSRVSLPLSVSLSVNFHAGSTTGSTTFLTLDYSRLCLSAALGHNLKQTIAWTFTFSRTQQWCDYSKCQWRSHEKNLFNSFCTTIMTKSRRARLWLTEWRLQYCKKNLFFAAS